MERLVKKQDLSVESNVKERKSRDVNLKKAISRNNKG